MPISDKWEDDHLDRINVARFLTQYLNGLYQESDPTKNDEGFFVLNLNATWGHGKTFLLKKWSKDLKENKYPVLMFDAWKNDYTREPLVGFISELNDSLNEWANYVTPIKNRIDQLLASSKKLINIGGIAQHVINAGIEVKTGVNPGLSKKSDTYAASVLKAHRSMKNAIDDFKTSLTNLIEAIELEQKEDQVRAKENQLGIKLPLYIFVDELDRCRPTYAIELLENIKHLFGVRGVFFVIATNNEQLSHSIQAVYGHSFDASGYLGRFFDQEYTLPEPDNLKYSKYLLEKYDLLVEDRFFFSIDSRDGTDAAMVYLFSAYADLFGLSLRDQEQVVHRLKAVILTYKKEIIYFDYLIFLLMLRKKSQDAFNKITRLGVSFDRNEYNGILNGCTNPNVRIKSPKYDAYGKLTEPEIVKPLSHIVEYLAYSQKRCGELIREVHNNNYGSNNLIMSFYKEAIKTAGSLNAVSNEPLSITEYPKLVKQVGHLSS